MRCLRFQQLCTPVQRTWKLPLWTISFAILIIHLIKAARAFQQSTHLQLFLPVRARSSLVCLFCDRICRVPAALTQVLRASCMCTTGKSQIMFPHAATYSAECFGYFPTSLTGKKKIKIKTGRGQRPESSNSLPSLRHITHKAHVTKSHDTSHSTRLNYVIPTFQAVHLLRHIQRFLHWHCLLGSPSGKGRGCNRYQTSHNTPILCTHAADLR